MALVTDANTSTSQVLSFPLDSESPPQRIYLKDIEWELNDVEDEQLDIEGKDEEAMKERVVTRAVSRATLPDRYKREEILEAMEAVGIHSTSLPGRSSSLSKELLAKLGPAKASRLLEKLKALHANHIPVLAFGLVRFPTPLLAVVRSQGLSLCQEVEELERWHCKVSAKTTELRNTISNCKTKLSLLSQVGLMWNDAGEDERAVLILALLNTSYAGAYYFFERRMEDGEALHEIVQGMLMDSNNLMQFEIESLVNSLLRSEHSLLFFMLNKLDKYLNEKIRLSRESADSNEHEVLTEYNPVITEFLASSLRHSSKALYSVSRLIYTLLELITVKQKDEYFDIYTVEELQSLEAEFLPRFESACLSAFAACWGLRQPWDSLHSALAELDVSLTVATAAASHSLATFAEEVEEPYRKCVESMLAAYSFFLPWDKFDCLPMLMNLLVKYKEFDVLRTVIKITRHKVSIFNLISLYCNVQMNDVKEIQRCIAECSAYHRAENLLYSHTDEVIGFLRSIGLTVNSEVATYQSPELNFYAICLDAFKDISFEGKYALVTAALWTKSAADGDHDKFWAQLAELLTARKLYLRAYQALSSINSVLVLRQALGRFVDALVADKRLSVILSEVPLPGLKHEVVKYLQHKANEQMGDYEQLLKKKAKGVEGVVNYTVILYVCLMESADYLGAAELVLIQHNKSLKHLKRAGERLESLYELLMIQKRFLVLCINALSLVDEKHAVISIVEDGPRERNKRRRELDSVLFHDDG